MLYINFSNNLQLDWHKLSWTCLLQLQWSKSLIESEEFIIESEVNHV